VLIPSISIALASAFTPLGLTANATGSAVSIPNAGFEDGTLAGWAKGSQTGTLGNSINGGGTGVNVFSGSKSFSHGPNGSMGSPTLSNGSPNPYHAPAVPAGTWTFSPKNATYAALLQPKGEQTFTQASAALGLSGNQTSQITSMLSSQAQASGFGGGNPTDAAWITREVELTAGVTYTMAWNYMATDYVPFNDGSITSLVPVTVASTPVITVNNFEQSYALLGFSNPGTGDYSTNSYGSTGWQMSTYEVSVTGTYKLGFTVFNLDDTALSPVLMIDSELGTTLSCDQAGGSCETFGGVEPNNETAPTLPPTTTTTATTVAPYLNAVTGLTASVNADGSVDLDWDAPTSSNVDIYAYGVTFYGLDEIGGTATGGWGVWTNQGTNYSLSASMFSGTTGFGPVRFGIKAGNQSCFSAQGVGPCVYGPETTVDATVLDPTPTTTTTTEVPVTTTTQVPVFTLPPFLSTTTSTTTTTEVPEWTTTTVLTPPATVTTTEPPNATPPSEGNPESEEPATSVPQYATPENEAPTETIPEVVIPEETQDTADNTVDDILASADNSEELSAAVDDAMANAESPEEVAALVTSLLDGPLSNEEFAAVVDSVFSDDLSTAELSAALDAVFEEPLSDEKFAEVIDAVLDNPLTDEQFAEVIDVLESDTVTEDQVSAAVDQILENEVTADQATELATSEKVLESIDGDQAAEIFEAVEVGELTSEEEAALVAAVTNAPDEVKSAFEETIDIFAEGLDDYVALGSQVDVGTRRSLIAASAAVSTLTAAGAAGAASGGSGGPSSNGNGGNGGGNGNGNTDGRTKKEEEGEQEASGEIAGPEEDEDKKPFTRNSIFKYQEN
jgi:hypothetical protein